MKHDWEMVPDTMEKTLKHGWEPRRRCKNCGKEQSKISKTNWGRVVQYYWEPLVGRCKPEKENGEL